MAISRADLLKQLLPGLNQMFGLAYDNQAKIDQVIANDLKKKEEGDEHRSISKSS